MTTAPALAALVATIAIGVAVGIMYLLRIRKKRVVTLHLLASLVALGLVAQLVLLEAPPTQGGPDAVLPLAMLGIAVAAGWSAKKVARVSWRGSELMLAGHAVLGIAGLFVFLAWLRAVQAAAG